MVEMLSRRDDASIDYVCVRCAGSEAMPQLWAAEVRIGLYFFERDTGKENIELEKKRESYIIYYVSPEEKPKNLRMFEVEGTPSSALLA